MQQVNITIFLPLCLGRNMFSRFSAIWPICDFSVSIVFYE